MGERLAGRAWSGTGTNWIIRIVCLTGAIVAVAGLGATAVAAQEAVGTPVAAPLSGESASAACASGRIRIGDLPAIDPVWQDGLAAATKQAQAWKPDARLVGFQVLCQAFSASFLWRATFYSSDAQLLYVSDTGEVQLTNADPNSLPTLSMNGISFSRLHDALASAGFPDNAEVNPVGGIDIRMSTDQRPFGPPGAPRGAVYIHIAVILNGQVQDIFVNVSDMSIYRYQDAQ